MFSLSFENAQLWELCCRLEAPGYQLPPHLLNDPLFAERYSIVKQITRECERAADMESLRAALAGVGLRS